MLGEQDYRVRVVLESKERRAVVDALRKAKLVQHFAGAISRLAPADPADHLRDDDVFQS